MAAGSLTVRALDTCFSKRPLRWTFAFHLAEHVLMPANDCGRPIICYDAPWSADKRHYPTVASAIPPMYQCPPTYFRHADA